MPNELDVEIEQWADAGEPTEDELRQNCIIDARLFDIEPKEASLPEVTVTIRISYNYGSTEYGGDHCIPVLFKLLKENRYGCGFADERYHQTKHAYFYPWQTQLSYTQCDWDIRHRQCKTL